MKSFINVLSGVLLAALGLGGLSDAVEPPAAPRAGQETQDIVFFAEGRPLLLRFRVRIDDRPLQVAWEAYMDKLFRYLDVNGDGVLSKEEALRAPSPQALFSNTPFLVGGRLPAQAALSGRDGKVSRAEMVSYYRRSGAAPFQFRMGDSGPRDGVVRILAATGQVMGGTPSSEALNDRLFALLDTDKNGKLSRAEMAAAPRILGKCDADDDEMVTATELLGSQRAGADILPPLAFLPDGGMLAVPVSSGPFHVVSGRSDAGLSKRLLRQYGTKGARKLTAKALGLDKAALDRLDADGDGELDAEELARFAERAPDLEFRVDLSGRGQPARIEHIKRGGKAERLVVAGKNGRSVLDLNTTRVELSVASAAVRTTQPIRNLRQQFIDQFKIADEDNKGYLSATNARSNRLFGVTFKLMDRDGDGKLYLKEVLAYFDAMTELSSLATASVVTLSVSDQGAGLFDLLDTDKDGRLSVRELRQLPKLLSELDRNGDGQLARSEVPRHYRATFEMGPANLQTGIRGAVLARGGPAPARALPRLTEGPVWFRKMDRNRDGDVSRREFLGTDEEFRRIDADGDGLISAAEATAYDRRLREPTVPDARRR